MEKKLEITKEEINEYPQFRFEGPIALIETKEEALKAIEELKDEPILGFDTETRAAFKKGERYNICLLQLATDKKSYLFRINKCPLFKELAELLSNPQIVKAGVAVRDDILGLKKLFPFEENNFVDLATLAKSKGIKNFGLRALTALILEKRLSKKEKVSNWEKDPLTKGQIHYASSDAVVGYMIYKKLLTF